MRYAATGEGLTFAMVVAGSATYAEGVLKEKLDEYFHPGIVTAHLSPDLIDDVTGVRMVDLVPDGIWTVLNKLPQVAGHYFTELHYNLS